MNRQLYTHSAPVMLPEMSSAGFFISAAPCEETR
jgi:hypothetical protein